MQTVRIGQAVVLMMIVALAASCSASKEYTSKLFAPRTPVVKDSQQATALRFLELDHVEPDQANWVTTDIITGRDTSNRTSALDNLAQVYPASTNSDKETVKAIEPKPLVEEKTIVAEKSVVSKKNAKVKNVKNSAQPKVVPVPSEIKTEEAEPVPVARNISGDDVRTKRSREQ